MTNPETEIEGKDLETAIQYVEQAEAQVDILTLNKAIATILLKRAQRRRFWQDWFCSRLEDMESAPKDCIDPLVPDLS